MRPVDQKLSAKSVLKSSPANFKSSYASTHVGGDLSTGTSIIYI
jgi:hypothetical protein